MPIISLPNGKTAEFPEGTPQSQIEAALQQQFGQQTKELLGPAPSGRSMLPAIAATAPAIIPGAGFGMALARPAISAAMRYGGEKLMGGEEPGMAAVESGFGMLAGEAVGGAGRAATRLLRSAWDKTAMRVTEMIGKEIPEFSGKTAAETFNRIVGGVGIKDLRKNYGTEMRSLWKANTGQDLPDGIISQDTREMMDAVTKSWSTAAQDAWQAMDAKYAKAMSVAKWVKSADPKKLLDPSGHISIPALQEAFLKHRASVTQAVPNIEDVLRMPVTSAARDIPGQGLRFGGHMTATGRPLGWLKQMPRAPRMAQEGLTPEMVSTALRTLGAGGVAAGLGATRP